MRFEALEQTLRLRLVSGPVDKKFFFLIRNSMSHTVRARTTYTYYCSSTQVSSTKFSSRDYYRGGTLVRQA
jgi:hypothetical protein